MRLIDVITTASANTFRSKLRSLLTITAIFIGAFTLTLTTGLGAGISKYIDRELGNLGAKDVLVIQADGSSTGLPTDEVKKYDPAKKTTSLEDQGGRTVTLLTAADLDKIKATDGIKSAEAFQNATVDYVVVGSGDKYLAGTDTYLSGANYALEAGKLPDNNASAAQVLLPSSYIGPLGLSSNEAAVGKTIELAVTEPSGQQRQVPAIIVGVKQKTLAGGPTLSINTTLLRDLRAVQFAGLPAAASSSYQYATARFDPSISDTQLSELKNRLKAKGYTASTIQDQIGSFKAVISGIVAVLNGFAILALLAASFGIINTLLMSVQERTKEIGLMKAMGMSSGKIYLLFSGEAVMLGFWGSLAGAFVAVAVGTLASRIVQTSFLKDLVGLQLLSFSLGSVAAIVGLVMLIAFIAGTLPAARAARQNPIDSLRYE